MSAFVYTQAIVMQEKSLAYACYWRNSLADAELGRGGLSVNDVKNFLRLDRDILFSGHVNKQIIDACFKDVAEHVKTVEVIIRPKVYCVRVEHGKQRYHGIPEIVTPLVTPAVLARNGKLYPLIGTVIPRDLLEPLEHGFYAIGNLSDLDAFLSVDSVPDIEYVADAEESVNPVSFEIKWEKYRLACKRLLARVCQKWPSEVHDFAATDYGYLFKKPIVAEFSKNILRLYNHIREHAPSAHLFDCYAREEIAPNEGCLSDNDAFSERLGHSNDTYPLAAAQRNALVHLLKSNDGEILAVNGPPGTGKTTLLLSVIATLWAKAALDGTEPPVIVAASTINQAVTNIIDAFGKDFATGNGPFAGRWLPDIQSYGAYFPSSKNASEQAKKYQTQFFFDNVESEQYITRAQIFYLESAAIAFPYVEALTVQLIVDTLRDCIQNEAAKLTAIETAWRLLVKAQENLSAELGADPQSMQAERRQRLVALEVKKCANDRLAEELNAYLTQESIFYSLFRWLPPVAKKRLLLARRFLKKVWSDDFSWKDWKSIEQIEIEIKMLVDQSDRAFHAQQASIQRGEQALQIIRMALANWITALAPLGITVNADSLTLPDADETADKTVRFHIFQLATHYWEGRWLLDMQALLPELDEEKKRQGRVVLQKRWRRRMKLTPCIVSTFYMFPEEMRVRRYEGHGFVGDYLYDFADLLIVDEAGQVLPEVAGASFALAKKALVIGDVLQIEPIWSIPKHVDIGNLASAGLLPAGSAEAAYKSLCETGKTAASGSVMRIAQCASRWHYDQTFKERGFFLYEHRRCFDEIIGYCNALCYHGRLIPKRGSKAAASDLFDGSADGLPAMGYLHIDGVCRQNASGSRENLLEAELIAAWLAAKKEELKDCYKKPLAEIVGVVTPFAGQVRAIMQACRKINLASGYEHDKVTVGTVHSLQGAERPLILFSAVYSKHKDADGGFIDRTTSMLNVAVSRAKNTFLVFGDMDVFALVPRNKPRGKLATLLFADEANALEFEQQPRRDLAASKAGPSYLRDAQEHDAFLKEILASAEREIHIVTPWIRPGCIKEIGAMEAMTAAIRRGVKVCVYTDQDSNTYDRDPLAREEKRRKFYADIAALHANQIQIVVVSKVHSKIVIGDDNVYCVGSFNWFSAARNAAGARHETSIVYRGPDLVSEIDAMKDSLRLRKTPFAMPDIPQ